MNAQRQEMLDAAWREAAEITHHHDYILRYGKITPETDLGLIHAEGERRSAAIAFIAEQTGISTGFIHRALEDVVYVKDRAAGTDDNPDYLVPPDWEDFAARWREYQISYEAEMADDEAAAAEFYEDYNAMLANPRELTEQEHDFHRQFTGSQDGDQQASRPYQAAVATERGNHDAVSKLTSEPAPGPTSAVRRASAMFDSNGAPGTTPRLATSDPGGRGIGPSPHPGVALGESPRSGRMR